MKLKPLAEILAMTKTQIDAALAPIRARASKARATLAIAKHEEKLANLESQINQACSVAEIDFERVADLLDQHALAERRAGQLRQIVEDLFPAEQAAA